jgi:phage terminase large subunit-like protein
MPAPDSGGRNSTGEIIENRPDALWSRATLEACRVREAPALQRIVVAVDPPVSSGKRADSCGIVAPGICSAGIVYVIADDTVSSVRGREYDFCSRCSLRLAQKNNRAAAQENNGCLTA